MAIPSWRDDLDRPIDLVEEVLRLYGTDNIPASSVVLLPGLAAEDDPAAVEFNRRAMTYLVGHDFHECVNLTLRPAAGTGRPGSPKPPCRNWRCPIPLSRTSPICGPA